MLLIFIALASWAGAQTLKVIPDSVQFGERAQQTTLHSSVVLRNLGKTTVNIVGVQTDCGCTVGTIKRKNLGPGEQTEAEISFETRSYRGPVRRNITLTLDNGETVVIPVGVIVNPYGDWRVEPDILNFGTLGATEEKEMSVVVTPSRLYRLTAATPSVGWLQTRFVPEGDKYRIWLKKQKDTPAGTFQGSLFLETTDPALKTMEVPFVVTVRGNVTVIPNPVTMGTTRVGQKRSVIVVVDDWKWSDVPTLVLPKGMVAFQQQDGTRYKFEVAIVPDRVGLMEMSLYVLRPKHTEDEGLDTRTIQVVPVIIRVLPQEN